jgi:hypothetical protein
MSRSRQSHARARLFAPALLALAVLFPASAWSQELAEFDYENLEFRGVALEFGGIVPTRVENSYSLGGRLDLGYLGPGVRIVPGLTYWSADFKRKEVRELEGRVSELVEQTNPGEPPPEVSLGRITWTDFVLSLDGHVVWSVPLGFLTYAGLGASAHILNGEGDAIEDTFVEDLLDRLSPGLNLHAGLEYPLGERFRFYGAGRVELLEDLAYLEIRAGAQFMLGPAAPGERPPR